MFPVLYLIDVATQEATGTTLRFCCGTCRQEYRQGNPPDTGLKYAEGVEPSPLADEVCTQCSSPLED